MGLLQPEAGVLVWMTLAFIVVFVLLTRFGFPAILRALDSRREFIDSSLEAARTAQREVDEAGEKVRKLLSDAESRRTELLREAVATREELLCKAREAADAEGKRILRETRMRAEAERLAILREARQQVALLAVSISEKMLRRELPDTTAQTLLNEYLLDELERRQTERPSCTPES